MRAMLDATLGGEIAIDTRLGSGIWSVEADPGEMELAIINLCVNARDAMPRRASSRSPRTMSVSRRKAVESS